MADYTHESSKKFRHGYMAAVIKLGQLIKKYKDDEEISKFLQEEWTAFEEGELARSVEVNQRSLGGQQPKQANDDDDDSNSYEMNMEKIMQRFSNFNTLVSQHSNTDDDDDEEEKKNNDFASIGLKEDGPAGLGGL